MKRRAQLVALALALGATACAGWLGLGGARRRPFEHRAHVLAGQSCLTCHAGVERAGEDGPLHLPDEKSCLTCHERPHDPRPCMGCHGGAFTAPDLAQARRHLRFRHDCHVATLNGDCARCHAGVARDGAMLLPAMSTCLGCHEHAGEFERRACDRCHVDLEVEGRPPLDHLAHDGDFARSHGPRAAAEGDLCLTCHAERFCAGCHGATTFALPSRLAFDDPAAASVHRAGFRARHAEEARAAPETCTTCHDGQSSCRACHDAEGVGAGAALPRSPHGAGWVGLGAGDNRHGAAARLDPLACASCHGGAGEALCVSCHAVGGIGGNPHPPGFSDERPLGALPCRLCHRYAP